MLIRALHGFILYHLNLKLFHFSSVLNFFMKKQTGCILKSLQTNNAKEFLALTPYLHNNGIKHRLTCPHTNEQNSSIERKHRHVEIGLALLSTASLPYNFWGEAFLTATTIINHLPSSVLNNRSPYEVLFNKKPNYEFFKVVGCACYPLLRPYNHHKFEYHASICLFLGYDSKHKWYLCLLPSSKTIISRHVIFNETIFSFSLTNNPFSIVSYLPHYTHSNVPLTVVTSPTPLPYAPINTSTDNVCTTALNNNSLLLLAPLLLKIVLLLAPLHLFIVNLWSLLLLYLFQLLSSTIIPW